MTGAQVAVIGWCRVARCRRPASRHLQLRAGDTELVGAVCEHCARMTEAAAFLVGMR